MSTTSDRWEQIVQDLFTTCKYAFFNYYINIRSLISSKHFNMCKMCAALFQLSSTFYGCLAGCLRCSIRQQKFTYMYKYPWRLYGDYITESKPWLTYMPCLRNIHLHLKIVTTKIHIWTSLWSCIECTTSLNFFIHFSFFLPCPRFLHPLLLLLSISGPISVSHTSGATYTGVLLTPVIEIWLSPFLVEVYDAVPAILV